MPDITKIKIGNERERSYKDFPANREFKKRAEDDNPGGGGWPADLPKPSVGGYGYTEQGEQTVIVDNESITTVDDDDIILGLFATPFDIVDGAYTVIFNGTEYNLNSTFDEIDGCWFLGDSGDWSQYPFAIYGDALITESAGDYEITVIMGSDTIHRVEGKYLPEGGIGWTEQGDTITITWDGDTEGKVSVQDYFYKISDSTPSQTDLVGAIITYKATPDGYIRDFQKTISQKDIVSLNGGFVVGTPVSPLICVLTGGLQYAGATFTETGLYFTCSENAEFVPDVTLVTYISSLTYYTPDTIHKIDEKYLPVAIPSAPSNDGVYMLTCTVTDGEPAYIWLRRNS